MENIQYNKYKNWLLSSDSNSRDVAINFFYHTGIADEEVDNILISLLKTEDNTENRKNLVLMFSDRVDEKFSQSLFDALQDDYWGVRGNAYKGLLKLGVSENHELLVDYRNNDNTNHSFERFCINESAVV